MSVHDVAVDVNGVRRTARVSRRARRSLTSSARTAH